MRSVWMRKANLETTCSHAIGASKFRTSFVLHTAGSLKNNDSSTRQRTHTQIEVQPEGTPPKEQERCVVLKDNAQV